MKVAYDSSFSPPAAVVDVTVRAHDGTRGIELCGKLDTGADVCAIPSHLVSELALFPERTVRAAAFFGNFEEVLVYRVDLEIAAQRLELVDALVTARPYVIVGRNALARFVCTFDGPRAVLTLRTPRPSRRGAGRARRRGGSSRGRG